MRKVLKSPYFYELLFLFLLALIPLLWYKPGFIGFGHDMGFPLAPKDFFTDRLYTWSDRIGPFGVNQTDSINGVFIHGLEAFFSWIGFSLVHTQQVTFIFWFLLPGLTMYILLRSLYPEKDKYVLRISGATFYMLNHYLLQAWTIAERTKFSVVAALPLIVLVMIKVIYQNRSVLKGSILLSLILLFLNGGAGIPLWGGAAIVILPVLVILTFYSAGSFKTKIKRIFEFGFLTFAFSLLLNAYWVYPYLKSFQENFTDRVGAFGGISGAVDWSKAISSNSSFINLLRLQGIPDWYGNPQHPFANNFLTNPGLILLSILFPVLAFYGISTARYKGRIHFILIISFLLILLISIPFTAGSYGVSGNIYDFFLTHIPLFSAFRTPFYKFAMALWFAFSFLIAVGTYFLYVKIKNSSRKLSRYGAPAVLVIYLILLGIYNYPFFTGSFFDWSHKYSTRVAVPNYIFKAKAELDKNHFSSRTLLLPELNKTTGYEIYDWRYLSISTVPSMLTRESTVTDDGYTETVPFEKNFTLAMYNDLYKTGNSKLLPYFGIDQVIVRNDFTGGADWLRKAGEYANIISHNQGFSRKEDMGEWQFYTIKNDNLLPRVYSPSSLSYINVDPYTLENNAKLILPEAPAGFIFDNGQVRTGNSILNKLSYSSFIVQGGCSNCYQPPAAVVLQAPKVMPDTTFYGVSKLLEKYELNRIKDQSSKIDYLLGITTKKFGALDQIVSYSDPRTLNDLIDEITENMDLLSNIYASSRATAQSVRSEKMSNYIAYFEDSIFQWQEKSSDESVKNNLEKLKGNLHDIFARLGLSPVKDSSKQTREYAINITKSGDYTLSYLTSDTTLTKEAKLTLDVNGKPVEFNSADQGSFMSPLMNLPKGQVNIKLPPGQNNNENNVVRTDTVNLQARVKDPDCKEVAFDKFDNRNSYSISFVYRADQPPVTVKVREHRDNSTNVKEIALGVAQTYKQPRDSIFSVIYTPDDLASSAALEFCLNGSDPEPALANVRNLGVVEIPGDPIVFAKMNNNILLKTPKMSFVALNQTKYLVKVTDATSDYVLSLNSRFDHDWHIREVDFNKADQYFTGEKRSYLNGSVTEFPREDRHLITDLIFPKLSPDKAPDFEIDGVFNGWYMPKSSDKIYLIEYEPQNWLYTAAIISAGAFVGLVLLYFLIRYAKKD